MCLEIEIEEEVLLCAAAAVLFFVLIIFGLLTYARWHFGSLEKQGIPVVKRDHFLLGSAMLSFKKPGGLVDIELMKKYGSVFGIYHGREPQVVICDPELIRSVTTKDADYFNAKREHDFGDPLFNEMFEFLPLEKWKFLRNLMTPVLTNSLRIRNAHPAMTESIKKFICDIKKQIKENGNRDGILEKYCINEAIYGMQTDLLARSQYSIDIGKSDVNNRFVQIVKEVMTSPAAEAPWLATYAFAFPFLHKVLPNVMINPVPLKEYCKIIKQLIDTRRQKNQSEGRSPNDPPRDFLDSLVEFYDNLGTAEYLKHNVNETTVFSLGISMFMGGQDQIALILGSLMYFFAINPTIQKKVQDEVDKVFSQSAKVGGVLSHESLPSLTYLVACINEAARLHPFFFRTERLCIKDWEDKERGLKIKKGQVVIIAMWAANRNPEYFEDPELFKPERFMPGSKEKMHPYAFTTFGFGNRNCPGKRLAMEMMTLIAAYLVKEFRFYKREDSGLKFIPAGPFFGAHEPIYLDVQLRTDWKKSEK